MSCTKLKRAGCSNNRGDTLGFERASTRWPNRIASADPRNLFTFTSLISIELVLLDAFLTRVPVDAALIVFAVAADIKNPLFSCKTSLSSAYILLKRDNNSFLSLP
jgi:hypothetical protein